MKSIDDAIRAVVADEIRRRVRADALVEGVDSTAGLDDDELITRAQHTATRMRRARPGGAR